ncbi:T6SS effector amidase Tae4 family protein [Faecalibacter bovis]|uniref:Uncharacterized protein n=1 Tax=Faecalibacter bovis TaxID=2898187 RepID=A0ABX7XG03_9FLAO|nr:T6SS effector amidase Tae4 family protein [Faecalibacter bovis]QTV06752.1 hypothetical protein J9309_05410 [Faecalibacter bovis]
MNKNTINYILTFFCLLFISSCSNDDETSTFESSKEENLMLHKNNSFLEKNEDVNFIINELSNIQKSNKNTQSSNQYDFIIHKENITYIKTLDGERESYTFFVEKEYKRNLNFVENLVISKKKNSDKFEAAIVTYFFPQGYNVENKNFQVLNSTPLDIDISHFSKSSIPLSKSSGGGCSYEVIETEHSCYSNEHFGAGESGKCDHKGYGPYSTYEVYLSCGSSGGGGGYNPSGPGSGSGGTETGPSGSGGNNGNGGANDGINTGITLPPSCQGMQCDDDAIINKINSILNNNHSASDYFIKNPQDLDILFALGIDFFNQNPNISWSYLENWFFKTREEKDYTYDASYWENPNLTFQRQNLPTWNNFNSAYRKYSNPDDRMLLVNEIGGPVKQAFIDYPQLVRGFCAVTLSYALNYSGVTIPNIPTTGTALGTVRGGDGKYYFLNAKALNAWMRKTFGINPINPKHLYIKGSDGGRNGENFPNLISNNIKGIYSLVSYNAEWASGHADLIQNRLCTYGCHFNDNPPAPIEYIDIWILD